MSIVESSDMNRVMSCAWQGNRGQACKQSTPLTELVACHYNSSAQQWWKAMVKRLMRLRTAPRGWTPRGLSLLWSAWDAVFQSQTQKISKLRRLEEERGGEGRGEMVVGGSNWTKQDNRFSSFFCVRLLLNKWQQTNLVVALAGLCEKKNGDKQIPQIPTIRFRFRFQRP